MKRKIFISVFALTLVAIIFLLYIIFRVPESQTYAGIEIGTSSVRFAIVEIKKTNDGFDYSAEKIGQVFPSETGSLLKNDQIDIPMATDLVQKALENIAKPENLPDENTLTRFKTLLHENIFGKSKRLPDENIFIVAGNSYQLAGAGNLNLFIKTLKDSYPKYNINTISEKDESLMEMKTLIAPPVDLNQILFVGVGSRSTKIGTYNSERAFAKPTIGLDNLVEVIQNRRISSQDDGVGNENKKAQLNSSSKGATVNTAQNQNQTSNTVENSSDKEKKFRDLVNDIRNETHNKVTKLINDNNLFRSKKVIIVSGGIGLDILCGINEIKDCKTIDNKDLVENSTDAPDYTPITAESLNKYKNSLKDSFVNKNDFETYKSPYTRYSKEKQLVGVEFIETLLVTLQALHNEDKSIYFYRRDTWIPGYLMVQFEKRKKQI